MKSESYHSEYVNIVIEYVNILRMTSPARITLTKHVSPENDMGAHVSCQKYLLLFRSHHHVILSRSLPSSGAKDLPQESRPRCHPERKKIILLYSINP
ncbi:MAG: hypothetical protein K8T10_08770, partial [Candidatus Eremiobacteraeota bacterium]|nr:hypothetical protein [Candidatus Eremiobacteraeota bacterium]